MKREDARLYVLFGAGHRVAIKRGLNCRDERRLEHDGGKGVRVSLSRADQFNQRPDQPRPLHANWPETAQAAALGRKKQFVGGIGVADKRLPRFLSLRFHCPRSRPPAPAGFHPDHPRAQNRLDSKWIPSSPPDCAPPGSNGSPARFKIVDYLCILNDSS